MKICNPPSWDTVYDVHLTKKEIQMIHDSLQSVAYTELEDTYGKDYYNEKIPYHYDDFCRLLHECENSVIQCNGYTYKG